MGLLSFEDLLVKDLSSRGGFLAICSVLTICFLLCQAIKRRFLHLSKFRGPWWAPYTRLWLFKTLASEDSPSRYIEMNEKYGPIVRVGPNHLMTSSPDIFRQILIARSKYVRGPWFKSLRLDPNKPQLITESEPVRHDRLRRQMAAGYDGKGIEGFEGAIDENLQNWIKYVEQHGVSHPNESPKEFEIGLSIQYLVTDMICVLCFGFPFGFIAKHADCYDFLKTLMERLPIVEKFSIYTEVCSLLSVVARLPYIKRILPSAKDSNGIGKIMGISREVIDERIQQGIHKKDDMLAHFLKSGLERQEAEHEIVIALFAGSDTTATSIRAILLHIVSNPLIYKKLQQEIDVAVAKGSISSPAREEEIRQLPYLQACIREGLRIFPPITYLRERVTPRGGDTLNGVFVPGGVNVGFNLPGLLLNDVFEPDAKVFRPERWLDAEPGRLREMERVMDLVFGWGSTRCLGIRMANTNQGKFFVEVFRRWDVVLTRPTKPWSSRCHGIFYQTDFFVRITPRLGAI